ncbi:MAG: DEAD/DEAH box helicase [Pseudomonadota bacterium]|nr:DEAD/DEAH box helicase [Pseudomonadota bacterium]MDP1903081.1 DEAD/DEAH box helicase [Pseudomonadota bacterium]MDP2353071.1 DEAD/DEAH box helicase [Pseudomonadota bacterium]
MTSPTQNYGPTDIARWFDPHTIRKAQTYGHRVRDLLVQSAEIIAQVQGRVRLPYSVHIAFYQGNGIAQIDANCTCPVGRFCKHCVAVLVAALASRSPGQPDTTPARPSKTILAWAEETRAALRPATAARKAGKSKDALHYFILPPALEGDARLVLFKGRVSEGKPAGKGWDNIERALIEPPLFVAHEDLDILRQLRRLSGKQYYGYDHVLEGASGAAILSATTASGRAWVVESLGRNYSLSDWHCLPLRPGEARPGRLNWRLDQAGHTLATLQADPPAAHLLPTDPLWYLDAAGGEAGPLECGDHTALLSRLLDLPPLSLGDLPVVAELLAEAAPELPRPATNAALAVLEGPPLPVLKLTSGAFSNWTAHRGYPPCQDYRPHLYDYASLAFRYGDQGVETTPGDGKQYVTLADGQAVRINRDLAVEAARQEELRQLGFAPVPVRAFSYASATPTGKLGLESEAVWQRFFADLAPRLAAAGWVVEYPRDFRHHVLEAESWEADLEEEGNGWFKLDLGILVEGQRLSLAPLLADLFHREPRWLDAKLLKNIADGTPVILHTPTGERVRVPAERITPLAATLIDLFDALPADGELRVSALDAPRLDFLADKTRWQFKGEDEIFQMARRLKQAQGIKTVAVPEGFKLELRPYQREGLAWLQFLREQNLAGILADDMGLGKTAQTLAHLLAEKRAGRLDQPALVVLPTSLIFNWKREAARCAPDLRVLSLHGPARADAFPLIPQHDVCLTTYPLLWRDEEELARHGYAFLILDEAQTVKNAKARAAGVVRRLQARHRLCLTGTPLENHLGELWAQFDFLLPGFLGDSKQFTATWRTPIEKRGDPLRRDLLARRIAPFILRRKKEDVAKELPAKTIIVRDVELQGGQRDLYETVRAAMDARVQEEIASKGFNRSQIVILDALLKLRQVCCDPRLLKTIQAAAKVKERAKLELLMDMLPELVEEGRRVLVFSQFTTMLALIAEELDRAGIAHVSLTGDTTNREEVVGRFQDGDVPVFLISLKAGGVGLNLTTADTVIHFDPWWNPAAENQATDRAHRIGQKNKVFVYKLVAAGSIEERIVALQEKKAALAEGVLSEDAAAMSKFGEEDLRALLAPLPGK